MGRTRRRSDTGKPELNEVTTQRLADAMGILNRRAEQEIEGCNGALLWEPIDGSSKWAGNDEIPAGVVT